MTWNFKPLSFSTTVHIPAHTRNRVTPVPQSVVAKIRKSPGDANKLTNASRRRIAVSVLRNCNENYKFLCVFHAFFSHLILYLAFCCDPAISFCGNENASHHHLKLIPISVVAKINAIQFSLDKNSKITKPTNENYQRRYEAK